MGNLQEIGRRALEPQFSILVYGPRPPHRPLCGVAVGAETAPGDLGDQSRGGTGNNADDDDGGNDDGGDDGNNDGSDDDDDDDDDGSEGCSVSPL